MPELPEVETICRGLEPVMLNRRFVEVDVRRPDLRFPLPLDLAARLEGAKVTAITRRAKFGLVHTDRDDVMMFHMGMSGRMRTDNETLVLQKHDHLIFSMSGDGKKAACRVVFHDPRRFGAVDLCRREEINQHKWISGLGPEPLGNAFSAAALTEKLKGKATPIKAALLDQRIIAGLGNIYVCEALFRAGISPRREARAIGQRRIERLAQVIRDVLVDAIAAGGSSLRDYRQADGELGYFQHAFQVYGREGEACLRPGCDGTVRRFVQSGRSSFACARCQR
ncbi:MAG: bifunctional DNA-formamidopyrimidine glycosylase/DNA-(apurinic or apyrimidinic site) lyase [Pseudomonadota bacterium]